MVLNKKSFDPILLAPLIFVCHFVEESPGFVAWFNAHVQRGINQNLFWSINLTALTITLLVVAIDWLSRSDLSAILTCGWLGLLMFANALFHISAAVMDGRYVPGLITAFVLYVPYFSWMFIRAVRRRGANLIALIAATIVGAIPMLAHGYLIVFKGSRLF